MDKVAYLSIWYIVAGGPSLKGYDWSLLKDKNVIAVNRAFQKLPFAKYVYFSDIRFYLWYEKELKAHAGIKASGWRGLNCEWVEKYNFSGAKGLDTRSGWLRTGNNSTYASINLAYHLGAKTIVILGLDMSIKDGTHWHDGYPTTNLQRHLDKMLPFFSTIVEPLEKEGIKVLNANLASGVECFEKIPLHSAHLIE